MDSVSLLFSMLELFCLLVLLYLLWPSFSLRFLPEPRWGSDHHRRTTIIKTIAPLYLNSGRAVTPSMITNFLGETNGLNPRETGKRLHEMVAADFDEGAPFATEVTP